LAAAYAFGIAKNHPFFDGNKRTAYVVCRTFLKLNDHDFDATPQEKYIVFHGSAAGTVSEGQLATWLRKHISSIG
jgi:death-on-curing protein